MVFRSSIGKVAGLGKPPANEITPGWFTTPSKALIGEGFMHFPLLERNSLKSTFIPLNFKAFTNFYYKYNELKNKTTHLFKTISKIQCKNYKNYTP